MAARAPRHPRGSAQRFAAGLPTPRRTLHWCEIPQAAALNAAALAALGRELWRLRCDGIRAVQLVERCAGGGLGYREAVGRERDGRLEIWDGAGWLVPGSATRALVGVRVTGGAGTEPVRWGEHRLATGEWTSVQSP